MDEEVADVAGWAAETGSSAGQPLLLEQAHLGGVAPSAVMLSRRAPMRS